MTTGPSTGVSLFSAMERVKLCRTAKDLANQLLEKGDTIRNIVLIPPEPDSLTDEDDFLDDDLVGAPIVKGDCASTYKVVYEEQQLDESVDISQEPEASMKKLKTIPKRKTSWTRKFKDSDISLEKLEFQTKQVQENLESHLHEMTDSPVKLFEEMFDSKAYELLAIESNRYAQQKNIHNISLCPDDFRSFVGFLIFSGYHTLPQQKLYWSQREDIGIEFVKSCFSRDRFLQIKSVLHVVDNDTVSDDPRKDFKVAPLYDLLNSNFLKFGIHDEFVCVDEQMVKYFGHNSLKQFIRNKPTRFGLKNWSINGSTGYCYNLKLYCGRESSSDTGDSKLCLGSKVVMDLIRKIGVSGANILTMDNFFCSHELLCLLREKGIPACGTIRHNRTNGAPLKEDSELKKEGRGSHDAVFDVESGVECVKW